MNYDTLGSVEPITAVVGSGIETTRSVVSIVNTIKRLKKTRSQLKSKIKQLELDLKIAEEEEALTKAKLRDRALQGKQQEKVGTWLAIGGAASAAALTLM